MENEATDGVTWWVWVAEGQTSFLRCFPTTPVKHKGIIHHRAVESVVFLPVAGRARMHRNGRNLWRSHQRTSHYTCDVPPRSWLFVEVKLHHLWGRNYRNCNTFDVQCVKAWHHTWCFSSSLFIAPTVLAQNMWFWPGTQQSLPQLIASLLPHHTSHSVHAFEFCAILSRSSVCFFQ